MPTDKDQHWSFASYAKFSCNKASHTFNGPYATRCNAKAQSLFWSEKQPDCIGKITF